MSKINHWCIVCGKGYHACDSCDDVKSLYPWKKLTCTSNHYQIRLIIDDYTSNIIDIKKANAMLKKCDLKGWERFPDNVKNIIAEIISYKEVKQDLNLKNKKIETTKK